MTIQTRSLSAFAVAPKQGRSPKPLNILGDEVFVKLANADTDGALALFEHPVQPMGGPPLHRHSREDEWFYVLRGEITVEIDGERMLLPAGGAAFAPRGTAHAFQSFGNTQANWIDNIPACPSCRRPNGLVQGHRSSQRRNH